MKRLIFTLLLLLGLSLSCRAQRFRVGARVGANITGYRMEALGFERGTIREGRPKAGFEAALAARLALTKHINLQAEFEFDRTGYGFEYVRSDAPVQSAAVHASRLEIPLMLGIQIGSYVRLFGGASFRAAHSEKSTVPSLVQVRFNDSAVALTGGMGLNIRKFFLEGRITGYPQKTEWTVVSQGEKQRTTIKNPVKWSITTGFFF